MKSIILLSGGLDSTISLAQAIKKTEVILALTFDYGQKAAKQEISAAKNICRLYKIPHKVIKLPWLAGITGTALVNKKRKIPQKLNTVLHVWVPGRNLAFIAIAASFAESLKADLLVTGFNREEAATFPDNSPGFVGFLNRTLEYSSLKKIKVISYTQKLSKKQVVALGRRLKAPFHYIYSCYAGGKQMCGKCESCLRLKRALDRRDLEKR